MRDGPSSDAGRERPIRALEHLAHAMLALRTGVDVATACPIAAGCAARALEAVDHRLLRLDPRSGALRLLDASGIETPYLAEPGGPVEWVLRHEAPRYDEGYESRNAETLLWNEPPRALAALPLLAGGTLFGCLLLAYAAPRGFGDRERLLGQTLADALALALQRAELHRLVDDERGRRVELERRMESDEESSSSLMGLVAHEIRTPLTAIKAYTETLLDTLANPHTPRDRFLGIINDECDRLARLVTDILDLSRLEAGQRPLRLARIELEPLVDDVLESLSPLVAVRRVTLAVEIDSDLVVEADADLLRRLFVNLIANALKFVPVGGHVTIRGTAGAGAWEATVEDDGPGIAAEDLPHVFERFYRGARPGPETPEGTGLGLAIARGIVDLHGGHIAAEAPKDGGTRFRLVLPLRQMASTRARQIARHVLERQDLRELLDRTVEMVAATMDSEIVSLMLVDPDRGDLFVAAAVGLEGGKPVVRRTTVRSGVAGSVAAWGRPILVNNIETDRRFRRLNHPQYSTKSLLSVPLQVEGEVLGVVNVNNKATRLAFDDDDLALLLALVERVGSAVERAAAYPDSGRVVQEASEAIRAITQLKLDGLLGGRNVVGLARSLARELGLPPAEVDVIGWVAAVKDLGMSPLGHVARAAAPLDADARHALMQHPEVGVEMIRPLEYLGSVRELILSHHERWDGSGYPRRLREQEIPIGARILAVVDAYDSMVTGRPYRAPKSREAALAELQSEAGRQFDPEVVHAMLRVVSGERVAAA